MKSFLYISKVLPLGSGTVVGPASEVLAGNTGQPSTITPLAPRIWRKALRVSAVVTIDMYYAYLSFLKYQLTMD